MRKRSHTTAQSQLTCNEFCEGLSVFEKGQINFMDDKNYYKF